MISSGASGDPPDLAHSSKWKDWIFQTGNDPNVDSLTFLGNLIEEIMDGPEIRPVACFADEELTSSKEIILEALKADGLIYKRGGIVENKSGPQIQRKSLNQKHSEKALMPKNLEELLLRTIRSLPRAIQPLSNRRKGSVSLKSENEYVVQDLLHALLMPWVSDIRPEEFTPSYAGSSSRVDFLLKKHSTVIETKIVRDVHHGKKMGNELIIDIAHYRAHPDCHHLWCVIYDPLRLLKNIEGLKADLQGDHKNNIGSVNVIVEIV
ncbi:hypothetical protein GCM10009069_07090 [Algimonas arctica]|uniref:Uncharacterized protein n=2 Tax=Algimonas arctica TaxID=1479486 RepID=A0A8J3CMG8_9PROT|nr:hypothetical protein GCM10009069_07090 [Algimonas arctica]